MSKAVSPWFGSIAALIFATLPVTLPAQDFATDSEKPADENDWVEFYYQKPTPDEFVARIREYAQDGTLISEVARPALIGFLSQVIRQNGDKIEAWYGALRGLSPEEMQILHTAMLYARIAEADAILKEQLGEQFEEAEKDAPKILEMKMAQPHAIDMLWGYFYATGSEAAIRRIVSCFIFVDAPDTLEDAKVPEGYKPLYNELPQVATWSLLSNAERHPKVLEFLQKFSQDKNALTPTELRMLKTTVLDEVGRPEAPVE